jgi:phosphoadenosine phosphosulfate reductase|nr:MAG TPA: phosphoadenosine-phosphosulfate reductase [Myoviridae sp. ctsKG11]
MSDKVDIAVRRLQEAAEMSQMLYEKPLVVTYSGGKDSDTVLKLAQIAKIPFEVLHSHTTVDAPETVYHVRETFRGLELTGIKCDIDYHVRPDGTRTTMWNLILKKLMPPTRIVRYCCAELKEGGGKGRFIVTGARWDESNARKKNRGILEVIASKRENKIVLSNDNDEDRRLFETCQMKGKRVVNPIVDWTTRDVLDFCSENKVRLCPLYANGWRRVGCVGCPIARTSTRYNEFAQYPTYKKAYIAAFDRMIEERNRRGKIEGKMMRWYTGVDVFHWWMEDGILPGQTVLPGFEEDV